jgi:hypothetical protein
MTQRLQIRDYDPNEKLWAYDPTEIGWGWRDASLFDDIRSPERDDALIYVYNGWEVTGFEGTPRPNQMTSGCDDAWWWVETSDGKLWALVSIDVEEVTA